MSLLIRNVNLATMDGDGLGEVKDANVGVRDGRIEFIGELPATDQNYEEVIDGESRWLTPGLIDCHTHLVWAGDRSDEFEARLAGTTYAEIARQGGGIKRTMAATRAADADSLFELALDRTYRWIEDGVTTVDIKSGYGQDLDTELRSLRVAGQVGAETGLRVRRGYLGLHATPPELDSADAYVERVIHEVLPAVAREGLADYADAFCEQIAFTSAQCERFLRTATELGMGVRLHADQLSEGGGAALAASLGAWSADHLEYTSDAGAEALARAGTVAVLLPGAFFFLREPVAPPVESFRRHGVAMAVATDCNPGSSPLFSLLTAANMACVLFGLSPTEALRGMTVHAASAVGLSGETGQLKSGLAADLALWDVDHPREILAQIGRPPLNASWVAGRRIA